MNFITKQVEKKVGVDLNGDGVIGSGTGYSQAQGSTGGGMMNQLEKVTHMDLNSDGRVGGGGVGNASQYNQHGNLGHPPNYNQCGGGCGNSGYAAPHNQHGHHH